MQVNPPRVASSELWWNSLDADGSVWMHVRLDLDEMRIIEATDGPLADRLLSIFKVLFRFKPSLRDLLLTETTSLPTAAPYWVIRTELSFHRQWGLGTSSTLISLIAQWCDISPYVLLDQTFGGSGYDVACAQAEGPIFYERLPDQFPVFRPAPFHPVFADQLYFTYLGQKQDSRSAIRAWRSQMQDPGLIEAISSISMAMTEVQQLQAFVGLMEEHEILLSRHLHIPALKEQRFEGCPFAIKSLGAWGGDFILIAADNPFLEIKDYFELHGCGPTLKYSEMALGV